MNLFSLVLSLMLLSGHAEAKKVAPIPCCTGHAGVNFCDGTADHDICGDGFLSACTCTYQSTYSDVCSIPALYNLFEREKASQVDTTNLQGKTWWTQCAPWTRGSVYALLRKRK